MDLTPAALIASLLVSSIGCGVFLYGKKAQRMPQLLGGLALMIFPCFSGGAALTLGLGGAVAAAMWLAVRAGL